MVDKELQEVNEVFIPIFNDDEDFLLTYAQKLIFNNNSKITIVDVNQQIKPDSELEVNINALRNKYPENISLVSEKEMIAGFFAKQDLMIIGLDSWKNLIDSQNMWLSNLPSTLIIKP